MAILQMCIGMWCSGNREIKMAQQPWFEIHLWDDLTWTFDSEYDGNETSPRTHDCVATDQSSLASPPHAKRS